MRLPPEQFRGPARYFYYGRTGVAEWAVAEFFGRNNEPLIGAPFVFTRSSGRWRMIGETNDRFCPGGLVPRAMLVAWHLLSPGCGGPAPRTWLAVRPDLVLERPDGSHVELGDGLIDLAWWSWGRAKAEAYGRFFDARTSRRYAVTVSADRRRRCRRTPLHSIYTRVTFTFTDARPGGFPRRYSYDSAGSESC